jgi:hypothetical protein
MIEGFDSRRRNSRRRSKASSFAVAIGIEVSGKE